MRKLRVIAGPCSAESEQQVVAIARQLLHIDGLNLFRAGLWKPRTSPHSFEGIGDKGLTWLVRVQHELGIPTCTEVATAEHVKACLQAGIRHLWIGARTTSNPFLVEEIAAAVEGETDVEIMVKNPISPDLGLWMGAIERFKKHGIHHLTAIHRGFSQELPQENGYRMSPCWSVPFEFKRLLPEIPLLMDPSHLGGHSRFIEPLASQAVKLAYDGLMVECHNNPQNALSDAQQQITPIELQTILNHLPDCEDVDYSGLLPLRSQINEIDEQLWQLIVRRQQISKQIGNYKIEHHLPILQTERYQELVQTRLQWAVNHGLSADAVHKILEALHEESVRIQLNK